MSQTIRPFVPIALYEGMIDALPAGLLVFRLDEPQDPHSLRLLHANPRATEFTGVDIQGALGKTLPEIIPSLYEGDIPAQYAEVAQTGKTRNLGDVRFGTEGGSIFAMTAFGLPDQSVGVMFEDVTREREEEERQIREVTGLADAAFEGIVLHEKGRILLVNRAMADLIGYPREELARMTVFDLVPEDSRDEVRRHVTSDSFEAYEASLVRQDGTTVPVDIRGRTLDYAGRVVHAVAIRDLTERVEARREVHTLRDAEAAMRLQARALATINRLNATLADELDPALLVDAITDAGKQVTGAEVAAFVATAEGESGLFAGEEEAWQRFGLTADTPLVRNALAGEGVARVDDVTEDPGYTAPQSVRDGAQPPVRSYLAAPVRDRHGSLIGGLFFGHPERGLFDEGAEQIVAGLADQAAIALQNARMYRAVSEGEERFRTLAESLPQLVWTAFADGRVEYYNSQWYAYTGMKPGTTQHEKVLTHPADRDRVVDGWAEAVRTGEPFQLEYRLERASDGAYRWFLGRALPIRDAAGTVVRWVGSATDIHDRKEAEVAIHRALEHAEAAERQLVTLVDNLPELAWTARPDGKLHFCNRRWFEYTGMTADEAAGIDWDGVVHPDSRGAVMERWRHSLATGEPFEMEFPIRAADDSYKWFLTRVRPLRDADDEIIRWIGTSADVDELRHLQTALAESEAQFRLLTDAMPQLIWTAGADGVPDYFNERWYVYTGAERSTHPPTRLSDFIHADDRSGALTEFARAAATGAPFEREYRLRRRDGEYRWFLARARPMRDEAGEVARWFGSATDIQDRKQGEAELEAQVASRTAEALEAAQRLDAVLNSTTDLIAAVDTDFRVLAFNEPFNAAVQAIIGKPLGIGMTAEDLLPDQPEEWERSRAQWRRVFDGESFTTLQRDDYPGLGPRAFETYYSPIRDSDGEVSGGVCVVRDVSERERASEALEAFASDLRLLHGVTTAEHATTDALLEDYLRAGAEILGLPLGAVARGGYADAGFHVRVSLRPEGEAVGPAALDAATAAIVLAEKRTYVVTDATADDAPAAPPDVGAFVGTPVFVSSEADGVLAFASAEPRARPLAPQEVEIVEILAELVGHALTVERAEAAVHRRTQELEERNVELEQFAYVASHDLQEPLRTISSFLQLLERRYADNLDERAREYITYAVDGSRRMQALIQGLLAYSRVGTRGGDFEPVDAGAVLEDVLVDLGPAAVETHAKIHADPLPTVCADPVQLHQLLLNLVGNAIKFHAPDRPPQVTVSAARDTAGPRPRWRFSVSDAGIGLDRKYADRVFQLFQRLHTRDEFEGTGIGLALCRKIVERHGGELAYEPNEGGGTTFTFTLPDRGPSCGDGGPAGDAAGS